MRPQHPNAGTDNARMLDALLRAYPNAVWNTNSRLGLTAHSRAPELRKLGWDVQSVNRRTSGTGRRRDYGYVLRSLPDDVLPDRPTVGRVALAAEVIPAAIAAERCGLTLDQLRYLDRMGTVPFDVVTGANHGQYFPVSVRLLQAAGTLVGLGIGLDNAIGLLRSHRDELAAALRLVAIEGAA